MKWLTNQGQCEYCCVGSIVRIAPNYYSIDDMEAIKTIYGHGTNFVKVRANIYHALSSIWNKRVTHRAM